MTDDSHHQIQMESQMPQSALQLSTVNAGKSPNITEQFQETPQRSQTSSVVRLEDSRKSFILPGQSGQQSHLPPVSNSNAVGDKQICGQSEQSFMDKIHHPFHIQGKHMAQLPLHMSTIDAGKYDDSRTTHLVQHQAPTRTDTKRSVVGLEDSSDNFMPKVSGLQSPLSLASSTASPEIITGVSNFNCSICGIGFKDIHVFNIHMFTHMGSKGTLYIFKGATLTSHDRKKHFPSHHRTERESPIEPEQRIIGTYRSHSKLMACQQCNFSTNSQEELINHYAQMHQSPLKVESKQPIWNDDDNNQRCLICNQDFPHGITYKMDFMSVL